MNFRTLLHSLCQKPYLLPLVLIFTYLSLLLDTVKYPGFMANHFYIDAKIYFTVAVFLVLYLKADTKIMQAVLRVNRLFLAIISAVYLVFVLLEGLHYTNYVLSRFHFHLSGLITLALFSLFVFLAHKFKIEILQSAKKFKIIYPLIVFFTIFFMAKNLSLVSDTAFRRNSFILFHLNSSYDERMAYQWGNFYKFMVFVRNNTPTDATIIIPPEQDPWLMGSGNDNFVRAFLYPRKVISETIIIPEDHLKSFGQKTYILVTWGKEACRPDPECHGWPRQDITAKRVIYKNPDLSETIEVVENTKYSLRGSKYVYGIIEI